ncbi:hypothetical protein ABZY90_15915 [Streptomyces sp. NPDC006422]|uniref:hypothetical protein n=1 Tax=unclassified Streptomyces TaxID=2593676 RepID=UPI0033A45F09
MTDPGDTDFYQRSPGSRMPEDRPRGGGPRKRVKHRGTLATILLIIAVVVVIAAGIVLFP